MALAEADELVDNRRFLRGSDGLVRVALPDAAQSGRLDFSLRLCRAVATRAAAALQRAATSSGSAVGAPAANLLDQLGGLRAGSYLDGITAWASESIEDVRLAHPQGGAR